MDLIVHPRETISFDEFTGSPAPAVALDGYVHGPSRWDRCGHYNFNHHDGSDRFTTRATCEQVALALRGGAPIAVAGTSAHINDDDPDVALSVWLLEHADLVFEREVAELCTMQGAIDTYGGAAGMPALEELARLAWVIDPWASRPRCESRDAAGMAEVVAEVCERVSAFVAGRAEKLTGDWGYRLLRTDGDVWALTEDHPLARAQACADGAHVFIAVRDTNGRRHVTIGKSSPFVDLDLVAVWDALNLADRCDRAGFETWGGGDQIGGSPRSDGTGLDLDTILDVVTRIRAQV